MKVLFLTTRKLLPMNDGGLVGSNGMLHYLHDLGHDVTLVNFYENQPYTDNQLAELKKYANDIITVKLNWSNVALNFSFKYANNIRKYTRNTMRNRLIELNSRKQFELVVIDHVQMFEYASLFKNAKIIIHTHNLESDLWFEKASQSAPIVRQMIKRSAVMLRNYEKEAFLKADGVIACSDTDREAFEKLAPGCNVATMHSYIKFERIKEEEDFYNNSKTVVFIGNYAWQPNSNAAEYLIDVIMPKLREMIPGIKLCLVGKNPTEGMRQKADSFNDIEITGLVDSIDPYIKKSDAFINAVTEGSGINIKMIEAMGKGIPIVTTEFGSRGIDATNGKELLVFTTDDECIDSVSKLINNKRLAVEISNNAREYYLRFIQPNEKVQNMLTV